MSHISKIKTQIVDKKYLLEALKDLGYHPEEGDLEIRGFGGNKENVSIRIHRFLSYDIGFCLNKEGCFDIIADWYGIHGIRQKQFTDQLTQRYALLVTKSKLKEQGFEIIEEVKENNQIRLVLRRLS